MKDITLHNKNFTIFIDENEINSIISNLANKIEKANIEKPLFIAILNGSFLFAADLLRKITDLDAEISFLKLASYDGLNTTGKVNELIGISKEISGRNVIILEDIIDTGITLEKIILSLKKLDVNNIKVATLLFKPNAYTKDYQIDYIGKSIANDFVVGYGLDYDELGRNLKHIYKLKNQSMLNIVLFGPPGAGKGTQSELLINKFNLTHLSTGDILRKEIGDKTQLGIEAKKYMDDGLLVPDEVVIGMIGSQLESNNKSKGFIFDGFPRTTEQATALDNLLDKKEISISAMISLKVEDNELIKRLLERGKSSGRSDDQSEEIISNRIKEYNLKTSPLKSFYNNQNKLHEIEGIGSISDISNNINSVINRL